MAHTDTPTTPAQVAEQIAEMLTFTAAQERKIRDMGIEPGAILQVWARNLTNKLPYRIRVTKVQVTATDDFVVIDGTKLRKDDSDYTRDSHALVLDINRLTVARRAPETPAAPAPAEQDTPSAPEADPRNEQRPPATASDAQAAGYSVERNPAGGWWAYAPATPGTTKRPVVAAFQTSQAEALALVAHHMATSATWHPATEPVQARAMNTSTHGGWQLLTQDGWETIKEVWHDHAHLSPGIPGPRVHTYIRTIEGPEYRYYPSGRTLYALRPVSETTGETNTETTPSRPGSHPMRWRVEVLRGDQWVVSETGETPPMVSTTQRGVDLMAETIAANRARGDHHRAIVWTTGSPAWAVHYAAPVRDH